MTSMSLHIVNIKFPNMKKLFYLNFNILLTILISLNFLNFIQPQYTQNFEKHIYNGKRIYIQPTSTYKPPGQINVSAIFKKEVGNPSKAGAYVFAVAHPSTSKNDGNILKDKSNEVPRLKAKEEINHNNKLTTTQSTIEKEVPILSIGLFEELFNKINSDQKLVILWIVSVLGAVTLTLIFVYLILCLWNYRSRPKFDRSHVISYRRPEELDILFEERRRRNDEVARLVRETSPRMFNNHQEILIPYQKEDEEKKISRIEQEVMLLKQINPQEVNPLIRKNIRKVSL
ncbi:Hypothetical protein SRAE_2000312600 [Strongyloides ratti]|uniref:Uncharacterized protein n=1 Tax=Strongyloides ratti TaxID=34506 RepID=A0A090MZ80_STRRB|nr:Hypothetical protein SRAE_2000312600 [Strongyloides ratti]CEF68469.1 Hypothetical protein SRAE_2000312600 [Strongyloides ratti]